MDKKVILVVSAIAATVILMFAGNAFKKQSQPEDETTTQSYSKARNAFASINVDDIVVNGDELSATATLLVSPNFDNVTDLIDFAENYELTIGISNDTFDPELESDNIYPLHANAKSEVSVHIKEKLSTEYKNYIFTKDNGNLSIRLNIRSKKDPENFCNLSFVTLNYLIERNQ